MHPMQRQIPDDMTCATCVLSTAPDEDGLVECRRFPPEVFVLEDGRAIQMRPRLHPSDGCGEHMGVGEE